MRVTRHRYAVGGWGAGELCESRGVVLEHSFEPAADPVRGPKGTPASPENRLAGENAPPGDGFVPELVRRIHRRLAGEQDDFADIALELDWCTPFQRSVLEQLREVPWGDVVTYGELAALSGHPGAARAAGSVCAANRFWLLVPCHRVVGAASIGGYGASGTGLKRRLLELEGVPVAAL